MIEITKQEFLEFQGQLDWEKCSVETGKDFHYKSVLYNSEMDYSLCYTTQPNTKGWMKSSYYIINN